MAWCVLKWISEIREMQTEQKEKNENFIPKVWIEINDDKIVKITINWEEYNKWEFTVWNTKKCLWMYNYISFTDKNYNHIEIDADWIYTIYNYENKKTSFFIWDQITDLVKMKKILKINRWGDKNEELSEIDKKKNILSIFMTVDKEKGNFFEKKEYKNEFDFLYDNFDLISEEQKEELKNAIWGALTDWWHKFYQKILDNNELKLGEVDNLHKSFYIKWMEKYQITAWSK